MKDLVIEKKKMINKKKNKLGNRAKESILKIHHKVKPHYKKILVVFILLCMGIFFIEYSSEKGFNSIGFSIFRERKNLNDSKFLEDDSNFSGNEIFNEKLFLGVEENKNSKGKVRILVQDQGIIYEQINNKKGPLGITGFSIFGGSSKEEAKRKTKDYSVLEVNDKRLRKMISSGQVDESLVFFDYEFDVFLEDSKEITGISYLSKQGLTGARKKICLVDTGADEKRVGTLIKGYNVFDGSSDISSGLDHGTWMARIIHEIVPDAEIYLAKVFDDSNKAYASDVIAGLEWCEEQNPDVISLSIGGGLFEGYCVEDPVAQKVTELYESGIVVVASAGNKGNSGLASPACAEKVISVGASLKNESISKNSNYFGNLDLLAPGEGVNVIDYMGNEKAISGTSVSAAIVSGGAVLILESDEEVFPLELETDLIASGPLVSGYPFVNFENYFKGIVLNNYSSEIEEEVGGSAESFSPASDYCSSLSGKVFQIKNSTGDVCFEINESGFTNFYGEVGIDCTASPVGKVFNLKSSSGTSLFWINSSNCFACIRGSIVQDQNLNYNESEYGQFFVMNNLQEGVAKVALNGNFFFREAVCYNFGAPMKEGLVSCWEFDETEGTTAYDAHNSYNGINYNAIINQPGRIDKCYDYDGTTSYVRVSTDDFDFNPLTESYTISFWIKSSDPSHITDRPCLITYWNYMSGFPYPFKFQVEPATDGDLGGVVYNGDYVIKVFVPGGHIWDGSWHLVVMVNNHTTGKVYIYSDDADLEDSNSITFETYTPRYNNYLLIGAASLSRYYDGKIDQIAIWNRALTEDQISALYNSGNGKPYSEW